MSCLFIDKNSTKEIKGVKENTTYMLNIPRDCTTLELHCLGVGNAHVYTSIAETEPEGVSEMLHQDMAEQSSIYSSASLGKARWLCIITASGSWDIIVNTGE